MCRLSLMNKKGMELIENRIGLEKELIRLSKECGGHGNGLLLIKDGQIISYKKGLKLTENKIVNEVMKTDFDWFLFHTRIASAGSIKDKNCHPYINRKKTFALMMNGTEHQYATMAKSLDITDTELVFKNINDYNIPLVTLSELTAKYMGIKDGKVFASNPSGSWTGGLKFIDKDEAIVIASSFDMCLIKDYESMKEGFWNEGEKIQIKQSYVYDRRSSVWSSKVSTTKQITVIPKSERAYNREAWRNEFEYNYGFDESALSSEEIKEQEELEEIFKDLESR